MAPATTSPRTTKVIQRQRATRATPHHEPARRRHQPRRSPGHELLGRYEDPQGRPRELLARSGPGGTVLVIDREPSTLGDARLVAHLGADEPHGNAMLVCREYLAAPPGVRGRCRPLSDGDVNAVPRFDVPAEPPPGGWPTPSDRRGFSYRLELVPGEMAIPALRWRRHPPAETQCPPSVVSLREAVGALESYEPVCGITEQMLVSHRSDGRLSTVTLAAELERVRLSPIVLNRKLREAVLAAVDRQGLSMSRLAIRCGRTKRDGRGTVSGETSWLARRIGILPEGGQDAATPWIHTDVLALIARRGLGISPREVEVQ